jgi:hypothetical protein
MYIEIVEAKLQTIALIIWMCEGTKQRKDKRWKNAYSHAIEVSNTDPIVIKIFIDYLRSNLKVPNEKLHGQIQIHEGDNSKKLESFWSKATDIPVGQFNKTIIRKKGNKPGKTKGTFKVRVYNKATFEQLQNLLKIELEGITSGTSSAG